MRMSQYCKSQGMNIEQHKQFAENTENTAAAIIQNVKAMYKTDTGVYYPIGEILPTVSGKTIPEVQGFIIQSLKAQGMEFFDNNTLWRF